VTDPLIDTIREAVRLLDVESAPDGTELSLRASTLARYGLVTIYGEIDFTNHAWLEAKLTESLGTARTALILDLGELSYCDSSAIAALMRVSRLAQSRGLLLELVGVHGRVRQILHHMGLDRHLHIHQDLESAVRWLESGDEGGARLTGQ
jgi:anti-sigma B factor antagonist